MSSSPFRKGSQTVVESRPVVVDAGGEVVVVGRGIDARGPQSGARQGPPAGSGRVRAAGRRGFHRPPVRPGRGRGKAGRLHGRRETLSVGSRPLPQTTRSWLATRAEHSRSGSSTASRNSAIWSAKPTTTSRPARRPHPPRSRNRHRSAEPPARPRSSPNRGVPRRTPTFSLTKERTNNATRPSPRCASARTPIPPRTRAKLPFRTQHPIQRQRHRPRSRRGEIGGLTRACDEFIRLPSMVVELRHLMSSARGELSSPRFRGRTPARRPTRLSRPVREARRVQAAALGRKAGAGRGQEAGPARVAAGLVHLHGRPGVRGGDREGAREAERGGHGGGAGHALAVGGVAVRARSGGGARRADRGRAEQSGAGAEGRAVRAAPRSRTG